VTPPLIITKDQADELVTALVAGFTEFEKNI